MVTRILMLVVATVLITVSASILLTTSASPFTNEFERGAAAYQRGDFATAYRLWHALAVRGNARAQSKLGSLYVNGRGIAQNYVEAVRWYGKAAEQGDIEAQNNLGVLYFNGRGAPEDYVLAYMWFDIAASQGIQQAGENRDIVAIRMTADQISEARQWARHWKPKRADQPT